MCFTGRIGPNKINTHICCGRKLHPRYVNGSVQGCCRDKIYNQQKSICCNGVYYSDMNPDLYGCCGSSAYRYTQQMCCGVNLHKLQFTSLCCGNQTYNAREKQCFQNMIIIGLWESKCGDDNYDTREHICCKKTLIHKNSSSLRCCGSSSFDPSINECVGNRIIQKGYQWCQHLGEYDAKSHDCCNGQILKRNGSSWRCCGNLMIDYDKKSCCAGKGFNKRNKTCCGGQIIDVGDECCSEQKLNQTTQVCCGKTLLRNEEIVQKSKPSHDKCCPTRGGGVSYDSVNYICTFEYRVASKSSLETLCGRKEYNPREDLCCNSKLFKNALKDGMACCHPSASIYNPKSHVCCFGVRKKGISCQRTRNRLRCPRTCKLKKISLRRYCNNTQGNRGRYEIIANMKKQMILIKDKKSCRCVYKIRRKNMSCKGGKCISFRSIIGISVEKANNVTLYIKRQHEKKVQRLCSQFI